MVEIQLIGQPCHAAPNIFLVIRFHEHRVTQHYLKTWVCVLEQICEQVKNFSAHFVVCVASQRTGAVA
jgi:hypothetical protein